MAGSTEDDLRQPKSLANRLLYSLLQVLQVLGFTFKSQLLSLFRCVRIPARSSEGIWRRQG